MRLENQCELVTAGNETRCSRSTYVNVTFVTYDIKNRLHCFQHIFTHFLTECAEYRRLLVGSCTICFHRAAEGDEPYSSQVSQQPPVKHQKSELKLLLKIYFFRSYLQLRAFLEGTVFQEVT